MKKKLIGRTLSPMLSALGFLGAMLFALCVPAEAQQPAEVPRIGWLSENDAPSGPSENLEAFRDGLRALGYIEGQNIFIDYRYAEGREDRLPELAAELVRLKVGVIVTGGGGELRAAKNATKTLPIVVMTSTDPVATGFIASLSRPGGNITGIITLSPELLGKRLEILKESFPRASRVAVFAGRASPNRASRLKVMESVARALTLQLQVVEVKSSDDFDGAFQTVTKGRADALVELPGHIFHENGKRIVDFAAQRRLPAVFHTRDFVEAGGLMSYGASYPDLHRRTATYVDKILKGAKPADLPVEQPTKFELVINLKTAKQLGRTIPPEVLYRADKIIK